MVSGAEAELWARRRLVVVGREDASCQPVGDTGRSTDGEVIRRRVGTPGAEVDAGVEALRRPGAGAEEDAEAPGAGGYWREVPASGVEDAGDAEEAGTV